MTERDDFEKAYAMHARQITYLEQQIVTLSDEIMDLNNQLRTEKWEHVKSKKTIKDLEKVIIDVNDRRDKDIGQLLSQNRIIEILQKALNFHNAFYLEVKRTFTDEWAVALRNIHERFPDSMQSEFEEAEELVKTWSDTPRVIEASLTPSPPSMETI